MIDEVQILGKEIRIMEEGWKMVHQYQLEEGWDGGWDKVDMVVHGEDIVMIRLQEEDTNQ